MQSIPETTTISHLKKNQSQVLAQVKKAPVLLLQNSKPAAVMVSPEEWNRIAEELRRARIIEEARRIEQRNNVDDSWIPGSAVRQKMAERGVHVAD